MRTQKFLIQISVVALLAVALLPAQVRAAGLGARSVTLGSSAASAVTTYNISFVPGTTDYIGAIKFEICDSPLKAVSCVNTGDSSGASFTSNAASVAGQTGISGFVVANSTPPPPTANTFWITNSTPQNISNATTVTVQLANVRNPSTANKQFYLRVTTYTNALGSNESDYGSIAAGTAAQVIVSGVMPESLTFCVGTAGTDCTNMTGTTVDLGTFSPTATNVSTSLMSASTNAGSGYQVTINGTTMTSGSNTIDAMGTQTLNSNACFVACTSATGFSQFGVNVRANNIGTAGGPFGAEVSGPGGGGGYGGYNTPNAFRFFSGDMIATVNVPSKSNLYTSSYLVNVGGDQAAGVYTATMTYICTALF